MVFVFLKPFLNFRYVFLSAWEMEGKQTWFEQNALRTHFTPGSSCWTWACRHHCPRIAGLKSRCRGSVEQRSQKAGSVHNWEFKDYAHTCSIWRPGSKWSELKESWKGDWLTEMSLKCDFSHWYSTLMQRAFCWMSQNIQGGKKTLPNTLTCSIISKGLNGMV